jgi:hypothetical protein
MGQVQCCDERPGHSSAHMTMDADEEHDELANETARNTRQNMATTKASIHITAKRPSLPNGTNGSNTTAPLKRTLSVSGKAYRNKQGSNKQQQQQQQQGNSNNGIDGVAHGHHIPDDDVDENDPEALPIVHINNNKPPRPPALLLSHSSSNNTINNNSKESPTNGSPTNVSLAALDTRSPPANAMNDNQFEHGSLRLGGTGTGTGTGLRGHRKNVSISLDHVGPTPSPTAASLHVRTPTRPAIRSSPLGRNPLSFNFNATPQSAPPNTSGAPFGKLKKSASLEDGLRRQVSRMGSNNNLHLLHTTTNTNTASAATTTAVTNLPPTTEAAGPLVTIFKARNLKKFSYLSTNDPFFVVACVTCGVARSHRKTTVLAGWPDR